ncbi:MAG: cache domain-containing protein [Rubrivivax sp.]|jgi:methyl-accepting chemotaxis protein|nr:cache domain-containing protein [Rubrivivax sp.]
MSAFLDTLLAPAARCMRRLRLPTKLGLLATVLLVPLLLLGAAQHTALRDTERAAVREREGARVLAKWMDVVNGVQVHRLLTSLALSGDREADAARATRRAALKEALAAAEGASTARLPFEMPAEWRELSTAAAALAEGRHPTHRDEAFAVHTKVIDGLQVLLFRIAEQSQLLLDPSAETYLLMDLAVSQIPPAIEAVSQARARGELLLVRGDASGRERVLMNLLAADVDRQVSGIQVRTQALQRTGATVIGSGPEMLEQARRFATLTRDTFSADAITLEPAVFRQAGQRAIEAGREHEQRIVAELVRLVEARAAAAMRLRWGQVAAASVALVLLVYLSAAFYASFYGSLRALHKGVQRVAGGDLSHKLVIHGSDEMAQIGSLVEAMNQRLSAMVAEIRSSAVRVGMAGRLVADGSGALAQRTEEQAASLRQTLASAQSLSQAVSMNASAAAELDRLTEALRHDAEAGGEAMRETVRAMSHLETSSSKVGEIIGTIDALAFQTNILALNAAVEAARAGEAGRGFAVVASEVRQLAQRSSRAAGEIRTLIGQSSEEVQGSVSRIQNVGQVLDRVVGGVRHVSDSLRTIATASAQQSSELEQVAQSVGSLDSITRENANMVTQSSGASQDLVERAQTLARAVSSIRLRQGSADEARALVDRALPLLQSQGLAGASAELHSRDSGFVDRDLYVFVIDRAGVYRLHGAKTSMEGHRVHEVPGIDGDRFVRDAWEAVARGGGWIDYEILNAETGSVMPKASYVVGLDSQLFVGCGVYRHDSAQSAALDPAAAAPSSSRAPASATPPAVPALRTARA